MSGLLLEFNRSDAEEVLKDQGIFTVSYEIELDSEDPYVWFDDVRKDVNLSDLVPQDDIWEKAGEMMSEKRASEFFDFIGSTRNEIGSAFVEWIDELDTGTAHAMLIKAANGFGLLGREWDEDWVEEVVDESYEGAKAALLRGEPAAIRAFAVMAMSDPLLKDFLEEKLEMEIPDINQQGLFGEEKNQEDIGNMLINRIGKDKLRMFLSHLIEDSWDENKSKPHGLDYFQFVREYIKQTGGTEPGIFDDSDIRPEDRAEFHERILSDDVMRGLLDTIEEKITEMAEHADYASEFDGYVMSTFSLPDHVETEFESWIEEKYEEWRDQTEQEVNEEVYYNLERYFNKSDYFNPADHVGDYDEDMIEGKVASTFPRFYRKWGDILSFEKDASLEYGFEMYPSTYIESLEESFEFLRDFYSDYNNQSEFEFGDSTGLHTNIGVINGNQDEWNYFKGFLFLNDNFATRGFEDRLSNQWSGSIRKAIMAKVNARSQFDNKDAFRNAVLAAVESNFPAIETAMNSVLRSTSSKAFGFSIRDGRIEFRYPGGEVDLDDMEAATMYYAYIVKLVTNPEFKRKEYLRKAVAFVFGIAGELEKADYGSFAFSGDEELSMPKAISALKSEVDNNPNPEAMFYVKAGENLAGVRSKNIQQLVSPEKAELEVSSPDLFGEGTHAYDRYFSVTGINKDAKTVTINVYNLGEGEDIAQIRRGWNSHYNPTIVREIYIVSYTQNISIYALGAAILEGRVQAASTEDYTKIKLFMNKSRALERLKQIWPWMGNMIKGREISMKNSGRIPYLSTEDGRKVGMGDFSPLAKEEAA